MLYGQDALKLPRSTDDEITKYIANWPHTCIHDWFTGGQVL